MDNAQFLAWLQENDACDPAVKKVGGQSAQQVWDTWDNPSELLWWVGKSGLVSKQEFTLLICGIARNTALADGRTVWDLLTDEAADEERAMRAAAAAARAGRARAMRAWAAEAAGGRAWAAAARRVWQLAYIREQLPSFVERFTEVHSRKSSV